ncbi:MAG: tyrosine-type recombinase/integrase [Deltaproteobacteria bacterium]|nr:tyrosine-type recombinase/integrase [Deltaproteobacteria bacterium]
MKPDQKKSVEGFDVEALNSEIERLNSGNTAEFARDSGIPMSYYLGLRPGAVELLSLKWRQVSWDSKTILVNSAHKGGPVKRSVPIHENLMPLLKKWRAEDKNTKYLIHYHGRPIKSIKTAWKGALASAKITRRITPL